MTGPNREQWLSLLRSLLKVGGTFLVAYGYGSDMAWDAIGGAIMLVAPIVWDMFVHTEANTVAVAAAIPAVAKIEVKRTPEGDALKTAAGSKPDALVVFSPYT
jgi:hypothetical protein